MPDGSHFIPSKGERLWKETPRKEFVKCAISSGVVISMLASIYLFFGGNLQAIAFYYGAPWVMFGWWLVTVTYFQHHEPNTLVYDDSNWNYVTAAFETVDRKFGFGIDAFHHHITDGHVVHHLFSTKIPHYNLPIATEALKKHLQENNLQHMYKFVDTPNFMFRIHKDFVEKGFDAKLAPAAPTAVSVPSSP